MKVNLAGWDRLLRTALGFMLVVWAAAGGPWWSWLGVYAVLTSSWGFCPFYAWMNWGTAHEEKRELE